MMNVLIFSALFYPHGGGAELATWLYCKLLEENGFNITVVSKRFENEPSEQFLSKRIRIYRFPLHFDSTNRYNSFIDAGIITSNFVNRLITQSNVLYVPTTWYSAIAAGKLHKKPVIVHIHNNVLACPTSLMYNFERKEIGPATGRSFVLHEIIQRQRTGASIAASYFANTLFGSSINEIIRSADALVFVSNAQEKTALSKFPSLGKKAFVVHNPIPECPLVLSEAEGIGYFGGKNYVKGFYNLIEAAKKFPYNSDESIHIPMAGLNRKQAILENGVKLFFYEKLKSNEIANLMKKLSIVVVPSLCPEPCPYSLLEAMLYGKIVIASKVGGIPEIIEGAGDGAMLFDPTNVSELCALLLSSISTDLAEARVKGEKNRRHILKTFSNETTVKSFIKIIQSLT